MEEPSVLDYLKSKLNPWSGKKITIPEAETVRTNGSGQEETALAEAVPASDLAAAPEMASSPEPAAAPEPRAVPWKLFLALIFALIAQGQLEPPQTMPLVAVIFYLLSAAVLVWAIFTEHSLLQPIPPAEDGQFSMEVRTIPMLVSAGFMVLGYLVFSGNRFNVFNLVVWLLILIYFLWALWVPVKHPQSLWARVRAGLSRENWNFSISRWTLLVLAVFLLAAFFRFYRLSQVPGEMFSDQAEKLLDVNDLLHGQTKIFFERNTGREFFQFYLTAAIILLFKTGISFLSLKLGTALAGLFTLPFIYKLGKEVGGRWVGLFALFLAGVAYWPNTIARIGLRFPLYPLFAAPALYYLVRGLRRKSRNDLILAGLATGLGLNGYSPFRIVPFMIIAGLVIYLLHKESRGHRSQAVMGLVVLGLAAFTIFLPLFRYATIENPAIVSERSLSRLTSAERELPGSPLQILLENTGKALAMPFWKNGDIWVHSVVNRPALDVVAAALFFLGLIIVLARYIRDRSWVDLFLVVFIPLLMLPSILSIAFPEENPSLNRTGGAYIPIFIIAAVGLDAILRSIKDRLGTRWGVPTATVLAGFLLLWTSMQSYDLVFNQFERQFMGGAWNTSDIGRVVHGFAQSVGTYDTAYVVPYPYWVDTRLVGITAGDPTKDYALWPQDFESTLPEQRTKMFILNPDDQEGLAKLTGLYPNGTLSRFTSKYEGKDFLIYLVPGISEPAQQPTPEP